MSSSRRPITWTATPTDAGRVEYDVDKVGTFTLGYCTSTYAGYDDQARLEVGFGRWRDEHHPGRRGFLEDAPCINTITLIGGTSFDPDQALAFLTDPDDWAGWLTVLRSEHGHTVHAPRATCARTAYIVSRLAQDFLERPDAPDLLAAHRRHLAPPSPSSAAPALTPTTPGLPDRPRRLGRPDYRRDPRRPDLPHRHRRQPGSGGEFMTAGLESPKRACGRRAANPRQLVEDMPPTFAGSLPMKPHRGFLLRPI